jgi:hypothetical protein
LTGMQAVARSLALHRLQVEMRVFAKTNFAGKYVAALD